MGANRSRYEIRWSGPLQPREREAVRLLGQCLPIKAIAARMQIRPGTVKVYLCHAYEALGFSHLPQCSARALAIRWSMAQELALTPSTAVDPLTRLLEDLRLDVPCPTLDGWRIIGGEVPRAVRTRP